MSEKTIKLFEQTVRDVQDGAIIAGHGVSRDDAIWFIEGVRKGLADKSLVTPQAFQSVVRFINELKKNRMELKKNRMTVKDVAVL